jgi:hypothetical protein
MNHVMTPRPTDSAAAVAGKHWSKSHLLFREGNVGPNLLFPRRANNVYRPRVDFHSIADNVETDLKNDPQTFSMTWIDELIERENILRRSEGERYTSQTSFSRVPIVRDAAICAMSSPALPIPL